ncbi:MAG: hypothetical protein ACTJGD_02185 [Mesonia hippocampi]|uniref:Uncharacterized membrane protein YhaH (DUF805 family) n=1 Tax=Mesonia hippocampi TaxID=1628250 RepID=A0A840EQL0_9FLAO|nr:hypothetical protein [Mesonia hippocampi]MBB4119331.1 uncharacterized membrane protein YhaH (DUF805 family) [Mesonia hippocampi]
MKYFIYFLIVTAIGLLIFNATMLDFTNIFGKESSVALVGILACLCVIVLMIILLMSKAIKKKVDG